MGKTISADGASDPDDLFFRMIDGNGPDALFERFDFLARTAAQDLQADRVLIALVQEDQAYVLGALPPLPFEGDSAPTIADLSLVRRVMLEDGILCLEDARTAPELRDLDGLRDGVVAGVLAAPVATENEGVIGAFFASTAGPRRWSGLEERYVAQLARTVSYTLQAELSLSDQGQLSEELSELDRIVTTLAADLAVPTSIYAENGDLAFANAALTALVPLRVVSEFRADLAWSTAGASENHLAQVIDVPEGAAQENRFRVSCSTSASGMMVCHWFPDPKTVM